MRRYHYLITIGVATFLGLIAGPLLSRYLLGIMSPALSYYLNQADIPHVWTVLSLRVWTPASQVLLIICFLLIGRQAHRHFESAAETVYSHKLAFYRLRDRVSTPGEVFDYLIWAYTYATVRGFTGVATFMGVLIIPPCLLATSVLWRVALLIPFFFIAAFIMGQVTTALDHIYGEIPRRLGHNLKIFGHLLNYLIALEEENSSSP